MKEINLKINKIGIQINQLIANLKKIKAKQ